MAALDPLHKGSQPRVANAAAQAKIARRTQQKPSDGSTHWSCRKMAAALGLSKSTVQRVWAQTRLKPHRLDRYMASNDPLFEEKAADIIGLYLNPPQHAGRVLCGGEDRDTVAGPARPGATDVARPPRTAWFRILSPRDAFSLCRARCEDGAGTRHDGGAAYQPRVHLFSGGLG